jgi:AraC-like DNA-binding protein
MLEKTEGMRDRSRVSGDPFSDVLEVANAQSVVTGGFRVGGPWAFRFPTPRKLKFFSLLKGTCFVCVDGWDPRRVVAGETFLLSEQRPFTLAGDLKTRAVDAHRVLKADAIPQIGNGEDAFLMGGHILLDAVNGGLVADVLPPWIHVRAGTPEAAVLQWVVSQLVTERFAGLPGAILASKQLAQLMFVQLVRAHLAEAGSLGVGLLRAITDPRIAPALQAIHREPGRAWKLEELAKAAAMSRTAFAVHFKSATGVAPLTYLTEWRMRLAERALRDETTSVSGLARSLGYTSESAFSNAFKRVTGNAPLHYRSAIRASLSASERE